MKELIKKFPQSNKTLHSTRFVSEFNVYVPSTINTGFYIFYSNSIYHFFNSHFMNCQHHILCLLIKFVLKKNNQIKIKFSFPFSLRIHHYSIARMVLEETYENTSHFDITFLMFVWMGFLPTVINPCIYGSWMLSR